MTALRSWPSSLDGVGVEPPQNASLNHFGWHLLAADRLAVDGFAHIAFDALGDGVGPESEVLLRFAADRGLFVAEKKTTLGVRTSPAALRTMAERPRSSRYATAEYVVPRSMPTGRGGTG